MIVKKINHSSVTLPLLLNDKTIPLISNTNIELLSQMNNKNCKKRQMYSSLNTTKLARYASLLMTQIYSSNQMSLIFKETLSLPLFEREIFKFFKQNNSQSICANMKSSIPIKMNYSLSARLAQNIIKLFSYSSLFLVIFSVLTLSLPLSVSGHSMLTSSLHRHHHPSHPHAQQTQYHRTFSPSSSSSSSSSSSPSSLSSSSSLSSLSSSPLPSSLSSSSSSSHHGLNNKFLSVQTYANQARYGIQADQASIVGMRHSSISTLFTTTSTTPLSINTFSSTKRPSTSDRSVRRVDPRAHSNHLETYLARRQHQHLLNTPILRSPTFNDGASLTISTSMHTTTTTTTSTTKKPEINGFTIDHCPTGPPISWKDKLDVAAKAYLAPVVLYGQLISLSEDYGGRIAATFRLLKTVKPEMSLLNHSKIAEKLNDSRFDETQVKLYFVRNTTEKEANQPPFCAHAMPKVFQELKTAERYILFAYQQVLSSREYTLPILKNENVRSHQVISLVTFAPPEVHSRNSSRMVRKVLCQHCAKSASVQINAHLIHVPARGTISLVCRSSGNPTPWIEWYRNGKRLTSRKRVNIITKRRVSHLTIRRSSFKRDQGNYECRGMNVVSSEPSVKRFQVIIDRPQETKQSSKPIKPFRPISLSPTSSLYNLNRKKDVNSSENDRNKNTVLESNSDQISSQISNQDVASEPSKVLWFQAKPCPMSSYCLNGGTCSLYEAVGEYVCQCADGYRGQRCEFKDIFNYHQHSDRKSSIFE